jgi:hypothetical protein
MACIALALAAIGMNSMAGLPLGGQMSLGLIQSEFAAWGTAVKDTTFDSDSLAFNADTGASNCSSAAATCVVGGVVTDGYMWTGQSSGGTSHNSLASPTFGSQTIRSAYVTCTMNGSGTACVQTSCRMVFVVSGFSSDPGIGWLGGSGEHTAVNITRAKPTIYDLSLMPDYTYSSGTAKWRGQQYSAGAVSDCDGIGFMGDHVRIYRQAASSNVKLSDYYRGGSLVPNTGTNTAVPTSGQIKLADFYGASR